MKSSPEYNTMDEMKGKAEVMIAKRRHGATGTVHFSFQAEFTRFSDLASVSVTIEAGLEIHPMG